MIQSALFGAAELMTSATAAGFVADAFAAEFSTGTNQPEALKKWQAERVIYPKS